MSSIRNEHHEIQLPLERCTALLSQFIEHAPAPIAMFDREMRYIMASRRFATDYNLKSQDLIGRSHYEVFPEIPERWKEIHRRCLGGATERAEEEPFPRADGTLDWVRWEIQPWYDESGAIGGIILFSEVITERKRAEAALRASDRRYRTLADNLPDLIYRADPDTLVASFVNPAIEKIYGYTVEEWLRNSLLWERTIHPDDRDNVLHLVRHARQHGTDASIEYRIIRKDGSQHWVTDRFSWERDATGRIVALNGIMSDITERKWAEEALKKSEQTLFTILETAAFAVALTSLPDGVIVYVNHSFEKLFGFTKEEVAGKTSLELGIHRDPEARTRILVALQEQPSMRDLEMTLHTKSDEPRICSVNLDVVEIRGHPYLLSTSQDITERKWAEEALADSERRYYEFVTRLPVAAYATDVTGRITLYNDAAVALWGRRPEPGNRWWGGSSKLYTPDGALLSYRQCPMAMAIREHRTIHGFEAVFERPNGTRADILANITPVTDDSGRVVGATNVMLDITERKQAEEAVRQSRDRLRELTARLVEAEETERRNLSRELHDRVGQMLAALNLNLGLVQTQLSEDAKQKIGSRLEDALTLIQETTTCVRDVMADLYPSVLTDFGLATALRSYSKRFTRQTAIAVLIQEVGDGGSRPPAQIETVLFRVAQEALTNAARHAGASQIRVTVDTAAQAARLTIEDDGRGFDPLTVVTDERHGWGLRTMRERIEGIGGKFRVDSSPGRGTRIIAEIALVPPASPAG